MTDELSARIDALKQHLDICRAEEKKAARAHGAMFAAVMLLLAALALFTFAAEWAKLWGVPFLVAGIAIPVFRAMHRARIRRALRALSRELTELARSAYAMSASMTNAAQDVPTMSEAENRDGAADKEEVSAWHYKNGRAGRRIV